MEIRIILRVAQRLKPFFWSLPQIRHYSSNKTSPQQVYPIGDYYASILESTTPEIKCKPPTAASPSAISSVTTSADDADSGPSILFSSRLSSPLERRSEIKKKSTLVAGVWVPPKPDEPDNCCMSGCVSCVWDRYGDELLEWATARNEADAALRNDKALEIGKKRKSSSAGGTGTALGDGEKGDHHKAISMDDDRDGSNTNRETGLETGFTGEELLKNVPVGIREFMKQEKRLKEKHAQHRTSGR
ncbi:hypothetical protein QTJ16_004050 [Diplocarpon rosae]|uniref:Oxidoreductase-like domain-containing protein n=1 Tax=Diplocarpon rosae TaxID=946125 RepID=A0AAD9T038_9HELO|nr:hypothetical protein QTJ16_004050 [Diplocarpon rosae]PBP18314.1 oxidoreductase-like protein [Diplocarpon rosae]